MKNPFTAKDAAMLGQVDPPPAWDPGDGSGHYLPDEAYFRDQPYVAGSYTWFNSAVRVVVECAMRLADSAEVIELARRTGRGPPRAQAYLHRAELRCEGGLTPPAQSCPKLAI